MLAFSLLHHESQSPQQFPTPAVDLFSQLCTAEQRPQKGAWPASSRDRVRRSRSTDASTVAIVGSLRERTTVASLCERTTVASLRERTTVASLRECTTVASLSTTAFDRQQVGDAQTSGNAWVSVRNDHSNEHRILTCIGNRHVSDET